jgi:hypothetical protein
MPCYEISINIVKKFIYIKLNIYYLSILNLQTITYIIIQLNYCLTIDNFLNLLRKK